MCPGIATRGHGVSPQGHGDCMISTIVHTCNSWRRAEVPGSRPDRDHSSAPPITRRFRFGADPVIRFFPSLRASGGMADALASGASVRKDVGVQVPPRPPWRRPPIRIRIGGLLLFPGSGVHTRRRGARIGSAVVLGAGRMARSWRESWRCRVPLSGTRKRAGQSGCDEDRTPSSGLVAKGVAGGRFWGLWGAKIVCRKMPWRVCARLPSGNA